MIRLLYDAFFRIVKKALAAIEVTPHAGLSPSGQRSKWNDRLALNRRVYVTHKPPVQQAVPMLLRKLDCPLRYRLHESVDCKTGFQPLN